jgi:CSLREA domain-containing protein
MLEQRLFKIELSPGRLTARLYICLLLSLFFVVPITAQATTYNVTKTADTNDGTCDADCSLREAVVAASAVSGDDTINVPAGTYTLSSGQMQGNNGIITLVGAGSGSTIIDGNSSGRIFEALWSSAGFNFQDIRLQNGNISNVGGCVKITNNNITVTRSIFDNCTGTRGGAIFSDQVITVTIEDSTFSNNTANNSSGSGGGAIEAKAVTVTGSTFSGNQATGAGARGGAIYSPTTISVTNSSFSNNQLTTGGHGGAIYALQTTTITSSTFDTNSTASGEGGAIYIGNGGTSPSITDSYFKSNSATGDGGAVRNIEPDTLTIDGSTFESNSGGRGGALASYDGTATIKNSTFSGNIGTAEGGGIRSGSSTVSLHYSTFYNNSAGNSSAGGAILGNSVATLGTIFSGNTSNAAANACGWSTITSSGYNVDRSSECGFSTTTGDVTGDPLLAALADNGGPTKTHAITSGPAVDGGPSSCTAATGDVDQRNSVRPQGSNCDIGAYEAVAAGGTTVCASGCTFTTIQAAIDASTNGDVITVKDGTYPENINFNAKVVEVQSENGAATTGITGDTSNAPVVAFANSALTSSAILDGFTVNNSAVANTVTHGISITSSAAPTLKNLIVKGNKTFVTVSGAGIYISGATATLQDSTIGDSSDKNETYEGSGLYATGLTGALTISGTTFIDNYATGRGAAIALDDNTAFATTITDSLFTSNDANFGGAIALNGNTGQTTIISTTNFTGNTSLQSGGAIHSVDSALSVTDGTWTTNNATYDGGVFHLTGTDASLSISGGSYTVNHGRFGGVIFGTGSGPLTISDATIDSNDAEKNGNVYMFGASGSSTISNTSIDDNTAVEMGAGIYFHTATTASLTLESGTTVDGNVISNTVEFDGGGINLQGAVTFTMTESSVSNNVGRYGGGIYLKGAGTLNIDDSTINDNVAVRSGGGVYVFPGSGATLNISKSFIQGNKTELYGGGGLYLPGGVTSTLTNCVITGNRMDTTQWRYGGGIYNSGTLYLYNTTIVGNYTYRHGGGLYANGTETIRNTIIYGNLAETSANDNIYGTVETITTSNTAGTDPLFVDLQAATSTTQTSAGDFRLCLTTNDPGVGCGVNKSPSMDTGAATNAPADDIVAEPRPQGTGYDLGAYEYPGGGAANNKPLGGYTADNVIPTAQIVQSSDGDGLVTITWKGRDDESENVLLKTFQYSPDGGANWYAPINGDTSTSLATDWEDNGGSNWTTDTTFGAATAHSFTFDTDHADISYFAGNLVTNAQIRFMLNDGVDDSATYVTSENFQVNNVSPSPTYSSAFYVSSTDTLTITGSGFNDIAANSTVVTTQADWDKFSWDIDGNSAITDVGFSLADVVSLTIDSDTQMTLVLASAKATAIETTANYGTTGGSDTLDFTTGFSSDGAGNISTSDGAANVPLMIIENPAFTVTKIEDTDGTCTVLDCSLREAVKAANADADASTIFFSSGINTATILITRLGVEDSNVNGDFDIIYPVEIIGNGATNTLISVDVSGGILDRVFHVTNASAVTIDGVTVTSGSLTDTGGCIYAADAISIKDSIISSCTATSNDGGGIYAVGEVSLDNVTFDSNVSGANGGALYANSVVAINGVTFTSNQADLSGGGIYSAGTLSIDGSSLFDLNTTTAPYDTDNGGGAFYAYDDVTLNATSGFTTFTNNSADEGGAILMPRSTTLDRRITMTAPVFQNNSALYNYAFGGALEVRHVTINAGAAATRFESNSSAYAAGAVQASDFIVNGEIIFDDNVAKSSAGALYSFYTEFFGEATFTNNRTTDNFWSGRGGAIYNLNYMTFHEFAYFEGNAARDGGAIEQVQHDLIFKNGATFKNNTAEILGGAIAVTGGWAEVEMDGDILFEGNSTGNGISYLTLEVDRRGGGAIFLLQSDWLKLNQTSGSSIFRNNSSTYKGGAIAVYGVNDDTQLYINNGTFEGNTAMVSGGAIDMKGGIITSSTFSGNSVDGSVGGAAFSGGAVVGGAGGAIFNTEHAIKIINSTITGNSVSTSGEGGAVYFSAVEPFIPAYTPGHIYYTSHFESDPLVGCEIINSTIYDNSAATANDAIRGDAAVACTLTNTIVANPTSSSSLCTDVTSGDYNLHFNGSCFADLANDRTGDPILSALADNGGLTKTLAIGSLSDARNNADGVICMGSDVNGVDQRNMSRTLASCDIGAYEYEVAADPDYFLLAHDSKGIYCGATETVSVTPKETGGSNYPSYNKTIVLDTQTGKGSWALSSGAGTFADTTANDGLATYTFTGSETTAAFALTYQEGAAALDVDVYEQGNSAIRDDDSEGTLIYSPSGFSITNSVLADPTTLPNDIADQIQNGNFTVYLTAFGTTANDATCGIIEGYTGTKSLNFWSTATGAFTMDGSAIATTEGTSASQNVTFTDGKAQVTANYDSLGNISFEVKDDTVGDLNLPTGIRGMSNTFEIIAWVAPTTDCDYIYQPLLCFNVYSLNTIDVNNADFQGVMGAGTDVTLSNYKVALESSYEYALHVGGDLTTSVSTSFYGKTEISADGLSLGSLSIFGHLISGGSLDNPSGGSIVGDVYAAGTIGFDGSMNITGTKYPGTAFTPAVDHAALATYFKGFSDAVRVTADTGTITDNGWGALVINAASGENIYSVNASSFSGTANDGSFPSKRIYNITANGPADSVVYVNVIGTGAFTSDSVNWSYNGLTRNDVLMNYSNDITDVTYISTNDVNILMPYTDVSVTSGHLGGNLIVKSLSGKAPVHNNHFDHYPDGFGPPPPTLGYFDITHDGSGIYCANEDIDVTPKQSDGADFTGYTGTLVLDTQSGSGSWSTSAGGNLTDVTLDDGKATYAFTGSESYPVTFVLDNKTGTTATFNIDVYDQDTSIRDDDTEGNITYSATGFTVSANLLDDSVNPIVITPIGAQEAGSSFDMHIAAYGDTGTATDQNCGIIESYTGSKTLNFSFAYDDPISGTVKPTIDGDDIIVAGTSLTRTFVAGQLVVSTKYKDVGQIKISMSDGTISGASSTFVVKPADIVLSDVKMPAVAGTCSVADPTMVIAVLDLGVPQNEAQTFTAGKKFCVTVTVKDSEGTTTPNFGNETAPETIKLTSTIVASGGVNNPPVTADPTGFVFSNTGGFVTSAEVSWGEVGIIKLNASIDDADYLGAGDITGALSDDIGRFIPADFSVTNSQVPELQTLCNAGGFSYIGDAINYNQKPGFTVTARNFNGVTTQNYTGVWAKLTAVNAIPDPIYSEPTWGAPSTGLGGDDNPTIAEAAGVITLNFNAVDALTFTRADPFNNFDAAISFSVNLQDADGVAASVNPHVINSILFDAGVQVRYGRIRVGDARESELLSLALPVVAEYYNNGFITNTEDTCTQNVTFAITDGNGDDSLAPTDTCIYEDPLPVGVGESGVACDTVAPAGRDYKEPPAAGSFNAWFRAPGVGKTGPLNVTATVPDWLRYDWDEDVAGDENPQGRIYFGRYSGERKFIFLRETFR